MKAALLAVWRLGALVLAAWVLRTHRARLVLEADRPVAVEELRGILPGACALAADASPRAGVHVLDAKGGRIGYAVRTSPISDRVVGYRGPTDLLIVLDPTFRVLGTRIRRSADTPEHVADVSGHPSFLNTWTGKTWRAASEPLDESECEGVSGATLTSLAVAESVALRLRGERGAPDGPRRRVRPAGGSVVAVTVAAVGLSFTRLRRRTWLRRGFQVLVVGAIGFVLGDLFSFSRIAGWAAASLPEYASVGILLLAAVAFLAPALFGRNVYCGQVCPYGAVQEWIGAVSRCRGRVPPGVRRVLRWTPLILALLIVAATWTDLGWDPSEVEPFGAFRLPWRACAASAVAAIGLAVSAVVPRGFCRYGCPTGLLLSAVQSRGRADRFGCRDWVLASVVLGMAAVESFLAASRGLT